MYDQTHALRAGESKVDIGTFPKRGSYVVRVSISEATVRNLTFNVQ